MILRINSTMEEMERKMLIRIYMKTQPVEGHTSNLVSNKTSITQNGLGINNQIGSVLIMVSMQEVNSYTSGKML